MTTAISYGETSDAWKNYEKFLTSLIQKHKLKNICEIGGGANPLLPAEVTHKNGINYTILDISKTELAKAPSDYHKIEADIASVDFHVDDKFDLVFSKMLAEHIGNAQQFHNNVFNMLSSSGLAVHFFPTLYTLPFLVNYLAPETLSAALLNLVAPRDKYTNAKFPAYYQWCRGPTNRQINRFRKMGYDIVEYKGFFGHAGYYHRIKPMAMVHDMKTNFLLKHPIPMFTSYACVVLKKP